MGQQHYSLFWKILQYYFYVRIEDAPTRNFQEHPGMLDTLQSQVTLEYVQDTVRRSEP